MRTKFTYFIISILLLTINCVFSQGFNSIASSDGISVLAAGNQGRIFLSTNGGGTFGSFIINPGINYTGAYATDSLFWVSASDGNLYKTGKNYVSLSQQNLTTSPLNSIYFVNSKIGYVCGDSGKVYKTTNRGLSWSASNSGIGLVKLNSISFSDSLSGAVAGVNGQIYLTTNGGANWTVQTTGTARNLLKIKCFQDGIYSAGEYGTLLSKTNAKSNWSVINTRIITDIRGIAGFTYNNVHICGGGGFIRNNQNGSSNFFNFEMNPMFGDLKDIIYTDSVTGYAISSLNQAIIKTTNKGGSWFLTAGTTVSYNWVTKLSASGGIGNNLCQHPKDRNSVFVMYNNIVYVSRDKGETWSQIASTSLGSTAHSFYVSPLDTNVWLAALGSPGSIVKTTNYGQNWTTIMTKPFSNYGMPLEEDQNNPSVFYFAPDGGGFYKSTDTGSTFTEISNNYPFRSPCDIVVMWDSSNVIYVGDGVTGSGLGQIFKSSNGGYNWVQVETNSSSSEIPMITNSVFDKSLAYATNWPGGQIYKTTNYGDNWALVRTNSGSGWAADICREDPTAVLTGSYGGSCWLSTDAGANFSTISIASGAGAGELFLDRGCVLDMRTQGTCKLNVTYNILATYEEHKFTEIPETFSLYQNYPNPFNPSTTIRFDIPKSGNISLKVFDIIGKEVENIFTGNKNAGAYEIKFDGSKLSSGVYFYRLQYDGEVLTKKLMLIK